MTLGSALEAPFGSTSRSGFPGIFRDGTKEPKAEAHFPAPFPRAMLVGEEFSVHISMFDWPGLGGTLGLPATRCRHDRRASVNGRR